MQGAAPDGNDVLDGQGGADTVSYGARREDVAVTTDDVANDGGRNPVEGDNVRSSVESITGGTGNDVLGNAANGALTGGTGKDVASFAHLSNGVTADLAQGTLAAGGASGAIAGIEELHGGAGGDSFTGSAEAPSACV